MQEVEGVFNGTWDYTELKGDTGPLVYPAGFVYFFGFLYYVTNFGQNIRRAQYIFVGFYVLTLLLVFRIYSKARKVYQSVGKISCQSTYIFLTTISRSLLMLFYFYAAPPTGCIQFMSWDFSMIRLQCYFSMQPSICSLKTTGLLEAFFTGMLLIESCPNKLSDTFQFYSLAVSIKMNILLFAPALLLAYIATQGIRGTIKQLSICAAIQVFSWLKLSKANHLKVFVKIILGAPFLLANPIGYISGAFNLGRVFLFEWTVNWRFLPEELFTHRGFHAFLLVLHLGLLGVFAFPWLRLESRLISV